MGIIVIGAGISGLTLGYRLARRNADVTVLEAAPHPGGHVSTVCDDGYLIEGGPNGFLDRTREPQTIELVRELGLEGRLREARPESKRRYIVFGGRLRRVPEAPPTLLTSDLLSTGGKLRLLFEPFAPGPPRDVDETVHAFAVRRIGREAADRMVDAAISGISAGDSRKLSVESAFPVMTEMEREHGSLIRAMIARRKQGVPRLLSFDGGLATLIEALAGSLGDRLRTDTPVRALVPSGGRWEVRLSDGGTIATDRVALAVASHQAAALVRGFDPGLAGRLEEIPFAGLAMVALAYRTSDLPRPLDGYGYLVTRDEGLDTLGVVWESSLFDGRAPEGYALLRCMIGGARHPDVVALPEHAVVERARAELARVLELDAEPERVWVRVWPAAIAQYTVGHRQRVAAARGRAGSHPGLDLVGTSYDGISITAGVASAEAWAERILGGGGATAPAPHADRRVVLT